jgi:hypothetical protein
LARDEAESGGLNDDAGAPLVTSANVASVDGDATAEAAAEPAELEIKVGAVAP